MKTKFKYLLKNVLLFTISGFVPKLLSFFLIPIYTSCLSTKDYGIFDLVVTTATLMIPIFTLDIQDAVLIFSMDKNIKKEEVLSTSLKINSIGFVPIIIMTCIGMYFNIFNISNYYYLFFICYYLVTALSNSTNLFCKGIDKVNTIVKSTIINSIITLFLNILLLKHFNMGVLGYLIANSVGMILALVFTFIDAKLFNYIKRVDNAKLQREMIRFSIPLIFSVISWWINNASDRYIVTWIAGISVSGLYAISYKIPSILTAFQNVFAQAWSISAIKEFDKNDSDGFVGKMFTIMNFFLCIMCSIIMIFNVYLAKLLYAGEFYYAWHYVPPLLLSVVFNAMSLFIGSIFTAVKDTKTLSLSTIIGAIVNIILNIILISWFSAYGAAIATVFSYFVVLLIRNIIIQKHIRMKTNNYKNYLSYFILLIQMILSYFGNKYLLLQALLIILLIIINIDSIIELKTSFAKIVSKYLKNKKSI